jgi:hypothetical protein
LKLHRRVLKQHYRRKGSYEYEQIVTLIPKKFHDLVKPFFDRDLEVSAQVLPPPDEGLMVILKPKESSKPP